MASVLQSATEKVLSLFGYDDPSTSALFMGKIAVIGGVLGVSAVVALIPVTVTLEKTIKIQKSGKEVYDFLSQTPANTLWPLINPYTLSAEVKEEFNNTQNVLMTQDIAGKKFSLMFAITKQSKSQTMELNAAVNVMLLFNIKSNVRLHVISKSNTLCLYKNIIKETVPLIMLLNSKRIINEIWGDGPQSVPLAVRDTVEDSEH